MDVNDRPWDGMPRWWVQYADGGQVDVVVLPVRERLGRAPGTVVLLDRTGRLPRHEFVPAGLRAGLEEPRWWLLDGWEALANVAKYLGRGSLLEAAAQLGRARDRVFQLGAVAEGVDHPSSGVTGLLDVAAPSLPPGIEATYPVVDHRALALAATSLTGLLRTAGRRLSPPLDTPLAAFVTAALDQAAGSGD